MMGVGGGVGAGVVVSVLVGVSFAGWASGVGCISSGFRFLATIASVFIVF